MNTLHLTLKKKWFDMIASGEKKEEYREIKEYWIKRLLMDMEVHQNSDIFTYKILAKHISDKSDLISYSAIDFDTVTFRNGYSKDAPKITVELKSIEVGPAKPEWSDNWQGQVFIIKLGDIIT